MRAVAGQLAVVVVWWNKPAAMAPPASFLGAVMRARLKQGVANVSFGRFTPPAFPEWWEIPVNYTGAVKLLVGDGQLEYEPHAVRQHDGKFAVAATPKPGPCPGAPAYKTERVNGKFQRKAGI